MPMKWAATTTQATGNAGCQDTKNINNVVKCFLYFGNFCYAFNIIFTTTFLNIVCDGKGLLHQYRT